MSSLIDLGPIESQLALRQLFNSAEQTRHWADQMARRQQEEAMARRQQENAIAAAILNNQLQMGRDKANAADRMKEEEFRQKQITERSKELSAAYDARQLTGIARDLMLKSRVPRQPGESDADYISRASALWDENQKKERESNYEAAATTHEQLGKAVDTATEAYNQKVKELMAQRETLAAQAADGVISDPTQTPMSKALAQAVQEVRARDKGLSAARALAQIAARSNDKGLQSEAAGLVQAHEQAKQQGLAEIEKSYPLRNNAELSPLSRAVTAAERNLQTFIAHQGDDLARGMMLRSKRDSSGGGFDVGVFPAGSEENPNPLGSGGGRFGQAVSPGDEEARGYDAVMPRPAVAPPPPAQWTGTIPTALRENFGDPMKFIGALPPVLAAGADDAATWMGNLFRKHVTGAPQRAYLTPGNLDETARMFTPPPPAPSPSGQPPDGGDSGVYDALMGALAPYFRNPMQRSPNPQRP